MEEQVVVLSVKAYNFKNSDGNDVAGCTVHYYPAATFDAKVDLENNVLGLQPLKATMPLSFYEAAKKVGIPCSAKISYVMRSQQGQMVLKPDTIQFMKN